MTLGAFERHTTSWGWLPLQPHALAVSMQTDKQTMFPRLAGLDSTSNGPFAVECRPASR